MEYFEPKTEFVRELRAERLAAAAKAKTEGEAKGRHDALHQVLAARELFLSPQPSQSLQNAPTEQISIA